ncbi:MAG TPA: acyl carrier protein [Flavobacterium sp.]|nr:acyl carrier protein [Flavobacterium sp.]
MSNLEKYVAAFVTVFNVDPAQVGPEFTSSSVDNWDSITQLSLVTEMEDTFDIMLDTEDILNFKSFEEGKTIVAKYGVAI